MGVKYLGNYLYSRIDECRILGVSLIDGEEFYMVEAYHYIAEYSYVQKHTVEKQLVQETTGEAISALLHFYKQKLKVTELEYRVTKDRLDSFLNSYENDKLLIRLHGRSDLKKDLECEEYSKLLKYETWQLFEERFFKYNKELLKGWELKAAV